MIINILENVLNKVVSNLGYNIDIKVVISNRPELSDYQCNDVFKIAKNMSKNPIEIGEEIVSKIQVLDDFSMYFKKVEFIKPGFINMTVSDILINECLIKMKNEARFGIENPSEKKLFFLDYGGPNVAKPLHVGHMRTAIVGESIKRIIRYMGHETISDVHLGDYGLQIGQVIYGILRDQKDIEEITLEYLEKIYPEISGICKENEEVKKECARITKELQDGNLEYQKLWKIILKLSLEDIKRLYRYLGVSFDLWQGESDAYTYIEDIENYLKKYDVLEISEGAKIIPVSNELDTKEIPPFIFQKRDGGYLYGTTDLATIYGRVKQFHPDYILYIVDNRQELHFEQVFRVCKKVDLVKDTKLEFLGYGTVNGLDGKPYKTRSGDAPKLDSLFKEVKEIFLSKKEDNKNMDDSDLDKIVNAILKFADLQNGRERDYIFDLGKFSNVVGKTGPYMLYTVLRIQKVLDGFQEYELDKNHIYNEIDRTLRLKLTELSLSLKNAFEERKPSYLVDYIYNIAVLANHFYQNNHIQSELDENKKQSWVYILSLVNQVLKEMLALIMIDIPKFM